MQDQHTLAVTCIVATLKWQRAQPWHIRPKVIMPFIDHAYRYNN
jgi:hypothetical protein